MFLYIGIYLFLCLLNKEFQKDISLELVDGEIKFVFYFLYILVFLKAIYTHFKQDNII